MGWNSARNLSEFGREFIHRTTRNEHSAAHYLDFGLVRLGAESWLSHTVTCTSNLQKV
jgi:hypothetical protein